MKHKVLILGTLGEFTELVRKAKARGYETIVCDGYPDGIAREYADKDYTIPVTDIDAIAQMCREESVDGIITSFSDLLLECMTKIADKAGLPCYLKPEQLPWYRDKSACREVLEKLGLPTPGFRKISVDLLRQGTEAQLQESIAGLEYPLISKVASIPTTRQQIYFIDNDDYFTRRQMAADEQGVEYKDNGERAIFFARGVLETVKKLRWQPDVIVCQGWVSAVVPFYIKTAYAEEPSFANSKVLISLYTNELKGELGTHFKRCVEFRDAKSELLSDYKEDFDFIELGKMAIDYSDGVIEGESLSDRTLLDYANEKSKPTLAYPGDDFADAYKTFINEVCPDEE